MEQEAAWKQALQVENPDNATAVLLDSAGKIAWQTRAFSVTVLTVAQSILLSHPSRKERG